MLSAGMEYEITREVCDGLTALSLGSGTLPVLATPAMIAMMENAAMCCAGQSLEAGQTTVGTHIDVSHVRPTPVGAQVVVRAVLKHVDGRRLEFGVEAFCGQELIGSGTHARCVVDGEKFMSRLK